MPRLHQTSAGFTSPRVSAPDPFDQTAPTASCAGPFDAGYALAQGRPIRRGLGPCSGLGPFDVGRALAHGRAHSTQEEGVAVEYSDPEMACHEQAVLAPRVEWLPGLGSNQRPSD